MRLLLSVVPVLLAAIGTWLLRRHGWRWFWVAALLTAGGAAIWAYRIPWITLAEGNPDGFGSAGVYTRWYPAAVVAMAVIIHLMSWRRIPRGVGAIAGALFAWLAWEFVTAYSFWIS